MIDSAFSPSDALAGMLRSRLTVNHVQELEFPAHYVTLDQIIATHRFILIQEGTLRYEVEGTVATVSAGQMIFVPAWVRRVWRRSRPGTCKLIWCEFLADDLDLQFHSLFWAKCDRMALERAAFHRMLKLWPEARLAREKGGRAVPVTNPPPLVQLQLEGELKAMLSRFWPSAQPWEASAVDSPAVGDAVHADLKRAVLWLNEHFLESNALRNLYKEINLSPNHFRLLFRQVIGCSPQNYLLRRRLRRARYLVHGSQLSFKEIAAQVGFTDPLFFSRQYRKFWGQSPRSHRAA